jgi:hypothetical protein
LIKTWTGDGESSISGGIISSHLVEKFKKYMS